MARSISVAIADLHHWSLMVQQTLPLLLAVYCECPGATWHHSSVRCPVIQPSLTDYQCRGLPVLMQMGKAFPSCLPLFKQASGRWVRSIFWIFVSCFQLCCCVFDRSICEHLVIKLVNALPVLEPPSTHNSLVFYISQQAAALWLVHVVGVDRIHIA